LLLQLSFAFGVLVRIGLQPLIYLIGCVDRGNDGAISAADSVASDKQADEIELPCVEAAPRHSLVLRTDEIERPLEAGHVVNAHESFTIGAQGVFLRGGRGVGSVRIEQRSAHT